MERYIEVLKKYIEEQPLGGEEPEGKAILEQLYYCYCICNSLDTAQIRQLFGEMDEILGKLSLDDNNSLFYMACDLCEKYQHEAFSAGFSVGFRLCKELGV